MPLLYLKESHFLKERIYFCRFGDCELFCLYSISVTFDCYGKAFASLKMFTDTLYRSCCTLFIPKQNKCFRGCIGISCLPVRQYDSVCLSVSLSVCQYKILVIIYRELLLQFCCHCINLLPDDKFYTLQNWKTLQTAIQNLMKMAESYLNR